MTTTQMKFLTPVAVALGIALCVAPAILQAQTPPGESWTIPESLDSFSFEDVSNWTSDTGVLPISFTNIVGVAHEGDINTGYALLVDSTNPAWLTFSLTNQTATNLILTPAGSLTIWVAPADWASASTNGAGPTARAELFSVGQWTTNASVGYWGLSVSSNGDNLYFGAQTNSGDGATATYLTAPISWNTNEWHFIGLSWSETNSALYLDGQLVTNGADVTVLPGPSVTNLYIGSDSFGLRQSRCLFDDISTFGTNLAATDIQNIYDLQYYDFFLNPYDNGTPYSYNANTSIEDYGTNLAVSLTAISTNVAGLLAMNTIPDVLYEIQSKTNLSQPGWNSEGFVYGSELTNWTAANVLKNGRPILFLRLRSWEDSDGSGMPDWWEQQYGLVGADPFAPDSSGDGWSIYDDFLNGWVPGSWHTPPPPQNFSLTVDSTGTNILLSWQTGGGPVDHYEIDDGGDSDPFEIGTVDNKTFNFTDDNFFDLDPEPLRVVAVFPNGDRSATAWKLRFLDRGAIVFRGPQGQYYLALPNIPQNLAGINFIRLFPTVSEYVDASNIFNGILQLPPDQQLNAPQENGVGFVQLVDSDGNSSDYIHTTIAMYPEDQSWTPLTNFANASAQMKENLRFLLRAAGVLWPFGYDSGLYWNPGSRQLEQGGTDEYDANYPESYLARGTASTDYEYYGFHTFSPNLNYCFMDELRPVRENFLWRNFIWNPNDFTNVDGALLYATGTGGEDTGIGWLPGIDNLGLNSGFDEVFWPTVWWAKYQYSGSGYETPLPLAFDSSDSGWIFHPGNDDDLGIYTNDILSSGLNNIYGLALNSAYADTNFVQAGSAMPLNWYWTFENYTPPDLQIVNYYFNSQTPFFNYTWQSGYSGPAPVLPGSPTFSTTNTSPLLITGTGQPITVSGWAKMKINNGNPNKFGYLEQYFDFGQAYTVDTNGLLTTNSAGLLSPYGEFFPTVPGPAALVTMPDIDPPYQRGTSVVNVIKLQLDVNHDGTMDLSFGGPDNTSQAHPFEFWINNDNDGAGVGADSDPAGNTNLMDYTQYQIRSWRNLEDFARMWICGVPPLPPALTSNFPSYSVTLNWRNTSGNPAINLYWSCETNGGIGYLTDTNIAAQQIENDFLVSYGKSIGTVSTNSLGFAFQPGTFIVGGTQHLLFEGAGIGSGELVLTVWQGTNILAQTSQWLDIHDVKDFYERMAITNNVTGVPSTWTSGIESNQMATASGLGDDTNIIVLVHGINVSYPDWNIEGDTVFKRLYWSGFYGKFAAVKWPCEFFRIWTLLKLDTAVFNRSEMKAYAASTSLKSYLDQLHERFPGYGVHLFAHSQGNSITSEAIEHGGAFDTYILTEGAVSASAYDVAAPLDPGLTNEQAAFPTPEWQPMGYHGIYTNMTGRIVNFYNTNDPVTGVWVDDQLAGKPNNYVKYAAWEMTHSIVPPPPSSWYEYDSPSSNSWYKTFSGDGNYMVTYPQESRAYVSRSLTQPTGRNPPETAHGVIKSGIDLAAHYGFGSAFPDDHSAQWVRPIQMTRPYYQQILTSCQLVPAP